MWVPSYPLIWKSKLLNSKDNFSAKKIRSWRFVPLKTTTRRWLVLKCFENFFERVWIPHRFFFIQYVKILNLFKATIRLTLKSCIPLLHVGAYCAHTRTYNIKWLYNQKQMYGNAYSTNYWKKFLLFRFATSNFSHNICSKQKNLYVWLYRLTAGFLNIAILSGIFATVLKN